MASLHRLWRWILRSEPAAPTEPDGVERPWLRHWDHLPKRSAGSDFTGADYKLARERAVEVARATLGEERWEEFAHKGYLDVRSRRFPGVSYRLRVGRRIEVICLDGMRSPWPYPYLCINPVYPLPELEFFAHLYLYLRDCEDQVVLVAAPQPWDQPLGRTF